MGRIREEHRRRANQNINNPKKSETQEIQYTSLKGKSGSILKEIWDYQRVKGDQNLVKGGLKEGFLKYFLI